MTINVTRSSMPSFEEYCEEIRDLWDSRWLTNMGAKHLEFERQLREYLGVPYLALFTNGHLALEDLIASFHFPPGSEVITTPFTFVSTTHAIVRNGLVPVFCDIDPEDFTMDTAKIEELITDKTVAILPVHVYGNVCHVEEIEEIAARHKGEAGTLHEGGIKVIYDAAHTVGVKRRETIKTENKDSSSEVWRSAADYGDGSILSFHATKVFHTIEGGAAVCHDEKRLEELDDLKNFGIRNPETCMYVGGNAKMNEFQAAMGICNLRHLDEEIAKRKRVYERYVENLSDLESPGSLENSANSEYPGASDSTGNPGASDRTGNPGAAGRLRLWRPQPDVKPNYAYLPVLFLDQTPDVSIHLRDRVWEALKEEGIIARKYFYPLTSDYQCYQNDKDQKDSECKDGDGSAALPAKNYSGADTPVARRIASQILTLPMYADLSMEDVDRICSIVRRVCS